MIQNESTFPESTAGWRVPTGAPTFRPNVLGVELITHRWSPAPIIRNTGNAHLPESLPISQGLRISWMFLSRPIIALRGWAKQSSDSCWNILGWMTSTLGRSAPTMPTDCMNRLVLFATRIPNIGWSCGPTGSQTPSGIISGVLRLDGGFCSGNA